MDSINWGVLLTESVFAALVEGLALGAIALYVWYRRRQALAQGKLEDVVLLSFNFIEKNKENQPQLAFRTPLVGSLNDIFMNDQLVAMIKKAAAKTTANDPIIRLPNEQLHNMMHRGLVNFSNQLNTQGQVAALTGQAFKEEEHLLALTYEPGAITKLFRIILLKDSFFNELDGVGEELTFALPYHRDRLTTLAAIRNESLADKDREATQRILAPFMVSAPIFNKTQTQQSKVITCTIGFEYLMMGLFKASKNLTAYL